MSSKSTLFKKAFSTEGEITKDEIFDILFVVKQIIGVILGIVIGMVGLTGTTAIAAYAISSFLITFVYVTKVLQPEQDTIEVIDIGKQHFMMGLFAFMLPWIITHNMLKY